MDCEVWKDIVAKLHDTNYCNSAAHALASGSPKSENNVAVLLRRALQCVSASEIIEGVIYAYRDWPSQPYCDSILAQFDSDEILSIFLRIENPKPNMKLGVLGFMEDTNRENAIKLASMFNAPSESSDVLDAVRYSLRVE